MTQLQRPSGPPACWRCRGARCPRAPPREPCACARPGRRGRDVAPAKAHHDVGLGSSMALPAARTAAASLKAGPRGRARACAAAARAARRRSRGQPARRAPPRGPQQCRERPRRGRARRAPRRWQARGWRGRPCRRQRAGSLAIATPRHDGERPLNHGGACGEGFLGARLAARERHEHADGSQ